MDWQEYLSIGIAVGCAVWLIRRFIRPLINGRKSKDRSEELLTISDPDPCK